MSTSGGAGQDADALTKEHRPPSGRKSKGRRYYTRYNTISRVSASGGGNGSGKSWAAILFATEFTAGTLIGHAITIPPHLRRYGVTLAGTRRLRPQGPVCLGKRIVPRGEPAPRGTNERTGTGM